MQHLERPPGRSVGPGGRRRPAGPHPPVADRSTRAKLSLAEAPRRSARPVEVAEPIERTRYEVMTERDGRQPDDLRPLTFERDYTEFAAGSVLVSMGKTRVLCTASVDERVPPWMRGKGTGWVTAEYSMLPGSTPERSNREVNKGKPSGRTQEIQRLIGRALRARSPT